VLRLAKSGVDTTAAESVLRASMRSLDLMRDYRRNLALTSWKSESRNSDDKRTAGIDCFKILRSSDGSK